MAAAPVSRRYAWYVLGLLTTINFINYVDRLVLQGMYDDLRATFHLSDGQIGALTTAFFVVHALTTLPFGWAADHFDRRKVLAFGILSWSIATLGAAWAFGFVSLLVLRGLVGLGEAAYGPVSNALLCETFRPTEKARTVAIFNGGMFAGACAGIYLGGLLGFPLAFQIVAVPGLALGVAAALLRVPPQRVARPAARPPLRSMFRDGLRTLRSATLRRMLIAGILISFAAGGYITWFADFIIHEKHFAKATALTVFGLIAVTSGPAGVVVGGAVADRIFRRRRDGRLLTMAIGFFLSVPFAVLAILVLDGPSFLVTSWLATFFIPWYNGPMAAVIDDVVDDADASTAQAAFTFVIHLCGTALAALAVGIASEHLGLRLALMLPTAATALAGVFALLASRHVIADMAAREARRPSRVATAGSGSQIHAS